MSVSTSGIKMQLKLVGSLVNTLSDSSQVSVSVPNANYNTSIATGIGSVQADRVWQKKNGTLSKHGEQIILDLATMVGVDIGAGSGKDPLGQTVSYENIVGIIVANENATGATGWLEVLPSDSEGWTPIGSHTQANGGYLGPGGILMKWSPDEGSMDIDSASSHRLTLRAYGGAVTYSVYLVARSSDEQSSSSSSGSSSSSSQSVSSASSVSSSSSSSSSISASSSSQSASVSSQSSSGSSSSSSQSASSSSSSSNSSSSSSHSSSSLSSQS